MIHERTRSRDTNDSAIVAAAAAAAAYNMTLPNDAPKRTRPSDGQTSAAAAAAVGSFVRTYIILYPIRCMYTLRTRRSSTLAAFSAIETAARH